MFWHRLFGNDLPIDVIDFPEVGQPARRFPLWSSASNPQSCNHSDEFHDALAAIPAWTFAHRWPTAPAKVFKGLIQSEALFAQVEMHIINAAFEGLSMWANDHDEAVTRHINGPRGPMIYLV